MRVLVVGPFSNPRCGEAEYSRNLAKALQAYTTVDVGTWDGYYPSVYANGYLPSNAASYDLIHVVWGPANLGHYLPEHFPEGVPLSVFLADVPPHVTCLLWDRADVRLSVHGVASSDGYGWSPEVPGTVLIEHPAPALYSMPMPPPALATGNRPRIGVTGIRDDPGHGMVRELCERRGWELSAPDPAVWLSTQDELRRLASCHVLAFWYLENQRGISMGVGYGMATGRPMVLSPSRMFNHLRRWPREFYWGWGFEMKWLEARVEQALDDMERHWGRVPWESREALSWPRTARALADIWEQTIINKGGARG